MPENKFKGQLFYILLAVGLVLSVVSSVLLVGDRADKSVEALQKEHRQLKAALTASNVSQYVENRIKVLSDLSKLPLVTSSVMGVEVSLANLNDFISSYQVLGQEEPLFFVDILGDVVFTNSAKPFEVPTWSERLLDGEMQQGISIISEQGRHYFLIGRAVTYTGSTEGIIFMLMSESIEDILAGFAFDQRDAVVLRGLTGEYADVKESNMAKVLQNYEITESGLTMDYLGSRLRAEIERKEYSNSIGLAILSSLLISFSILALFFHSLLVNPYKKLARSEEESRRHKERFELAIAGSNDGIWDWDVSSDVAYYSPRYREMMGYSGDDTLNFPDLIGSFYNTLHPDDKEQVLSLLDQHLKGDAPFDTTFRLRQNGDAYRYFRAKGVALKNDAGEAIRMAGSLTDVTELKSKQEQLELARDEAEAANVAKSAFLANMSHEIRTPMNGILGSLQVLQRKELDNETIDLIEKAVVSCQSLLSIINDILDFSKIESGKLKLEYISSDLHQLVKAVFAELRPMAESKGLSLELRIENNTHLTRLVDPVRVKQVLINLVGNAIKFTKVGKIDVYLTGTEEMVKFVVTDTGIGMNEFALKNLFGRFEQADKSITRKFGGTGLGLAITKQLAELMGGTISVQSEVNKGSEFTVRIPCEESSINELLETKEQIVSAPNLKDFTILLAEDNRINQSIFLAMVKATNVKVIVANDGLEAINLYRKFRPSLVFMDIQMPVMDGLAAFSEISMDPDRAPVIALTANVMKEDITKYQEVGFDAYMAKPIEMNQLYSNLNLFLNQAQISQQASETTEKDNSNL